MSKERRHLTIEEQRLALRMLMGNYEPEWYDSKGIVDNKDLTIAKRLKVGKSTISNFLNRFLLVRQKLLDDLIESNADPKDIANQLESLQSSYPH